MPVIVLSTGRCGTKSFAEYMGWEHEPDGIEPDYLKLKRRINLARRKGKDYGETSHFWKDQLELLQRNPSIRFLHLIRDPLAVCESFLFHTDFYKEDMELHAYQCRVIPGYEKEWSQMDRCQKIQAYVSYWNSVFIQLRCPVVRLEDLMKRPGFPHRNARER